MRDRMDSELHRKSEDFCMMEVHQALERVGGNQTLVAEQLGINRATVKKYKDRYRESRRGSVYSVKPISLGGF